MTTHSQPVTLTTKRGVTVHLDHVMPENLLPYTGQLELVYCAAFGAIPWSESARQARRFVLRLLDHTASGGFRLLTASIGHELVGLTYGRIALSRDTQVEESYLSLIQWVGPDVAEATLYEAFELTELAVAPRWQGHGIGALLHDRLLAVAPTERAWLLTHPAAERAQSLYRSRGWTPVTDVGPLADGGRRLLMARGC